MKEAFGELDCADEHGGLMLVVDQIEKVWINNQDSDATVTGLLLAAKHTMASLPRVQCVTMLRDDIYALIQFQDRDKFRGDEMRIDWNKDLLANLILLRAQASVRIRSLSPHDLWSEVFPGAVGDRNVPDYLVSRTLMRPRDLIQLCNLCRDTALKNDRDRITQDDVREAVVQYSNWKLQDLVGEYRINYPFLADLLVLFQSGTYILTMPTIAARLTTIRDGLAARYPEYSTVFEAETVVGILYGIGLLGVLRNGEAQYSYEHPSPAQFEPQGLVIHPAFRDALRSTSGVDTRPYGSIMEELSTRERQYRSRLLFRQVGEVRAVRAFRASIEPVVLRTLHQIASRVQELELSNELVAEIQGELDRILADVEYAEPWVLPALLLEVQTYLARLAARLRDFTEIDPLGIAQFVRVLEQGPGVVSFCPVTPWNRHG